MKVKEHLNLLGLINLLGLKAQDKISGFKGVIDSIAFDLYGCVQASLMPPIDEKGQKQEGYWFDIKRLKITSKKTVMQLPNFDYGVQAEGKQGSADKPMQTKKASIR